jgi:hypothetical protein
LQKNIIHQRRISSKKEEIHLIERINALQKIKTTLIADDYSFVTTFSAAEDLFFGCTVFA